MLRERPRRGRRGIGRPSAQTVGTALVVVGLGAALVLALSPAPYVIRSPGPVTNTLGEVTYEGESVPLIEVEGADTYPTAGTLDLLTVTVTSPDSAPRWIDIALSWFDPRNAVLPRESVYAPGTTVEESREQAQVQMQNSQQEAVAAALTELGYDFGSEVRVALVFDDLPAAGVLEEDDVILAVDGTEVTDASGLVSSITEHGTESPLSLTIRRDGAEQTVEVTPVESGGADSRPVIGVQPAVDYDFPIDVTIQLENVGGPSAGQMFALGIIDTLTPGELNGGLDVAGTGTIDADGEIGPIGGIRQKLYGALDAGAEWFLAPESNCNEVVGHVPDGLQVIAVSTLAESIDALGVIADGGDTAALPTCEG